MLFNQVSCFIMYCSNFCLHWSLAFFFYSSEKLFIWMMLAFLEIATYLWIYLFLILYSLSLVSLTSVSEKVLSRHDLLVLPFHNLTFTYNIVSPHTSKYAAYIVYHLNSKSEVLTPKPGRFDLGTPCHDEWRRGGSMTRGCLLILKSIMVILKKKGIWEVVLATFSTSQMKFGNSSFQFSFYQLYHPPYIIFLPKRCIISVYF